MEGAGAISLARQTGESFRGAEGIGRSGGEKSENPTPLFFFLLFAFSAAPGRRMRGQAHCFNAVSIFNVKILSLKNPIHLAIFTANFLGLHYAEKCALKTAKK